jgi:hypothetical protein
MTSESAAVHHLPLAGEASSCLAHVPLITVWPGFTPPHPRPLAESSPTAPSAGISFREPSLSVPSRLLAAVSTGSHPRWQRACLVAQQSLVWLPAQIAWPAAAMAGSPG